MESKTTKASKVPPPSYRMPFNLKDTAARLRALPFVAESAFGVDVIVMQSC